MTENKRFVYYEHKGADYILDTPNKSLDFIEMLGDCLEAEEIVDLLNCLNDENEQLKQSYKEFEDECQSTFNAMNRKQNDLYRKNFKLKEENEQLKQRNDRQAKQLDRLYSLIEEKDWTALSDIIDDFKRCEEQLQKEWGTYDDFK